jgi:hypothetical protein
MENIVNEKAFKLIEKLFNRKKSPNTDSPEVLIGSINEKEPLDLSDRLAGTGMYRTVSSQGDCICITFNDGELEFGVQEKSLEEFNELVENILLLPELNEIVSRDFVERVSFEWLVDAKRKGIVQQPLIKSLRVKMDNEIQEKDFYFPISNLEIIEHFKIGNVEFIYFTAQYMDQLFESLKRSPAKFTKENFDEIFRKDYQGRVLAKISVSAENQMAESIAKRQVELSMDVLKAIALVYDTFGQLNPFELSYRMNYQVHNTFLTKERSSEFGFALNISFNNSQVFTVEKSFIENATQSGLNALSNFITLNNSDELYRFIISGLENFSFALSIADLHRRAIALITVLESLLLEEDLNYKTERVAKARIQKVITGTTLEKEKMHKIFSNIYQIRHKMVHKALRLPIDKNELAAAQVYVLLLLLNFVGLNTEQNIKDKVQLFSYLDNAPV